MLKLFCGRHSVDCSLDSLNYVVGAKCSESCGVPVVRRDHEVAVRLEIGGEAANRLVELEGFVDVVADCGEA